MRESGSFYLLFIAERVLKLIDMNESNQEYIGRSGGEMKGDERNVNIVL